MNFIMRALTAKFDLKNHRYSVNDVLKCVVLDMHEEFNQIHAKAKLKIKKLPQLKKRKPSLAKKLRDMGLEFEGGEK